MGKNINTHPPSKVKQLAEKLGIREVKPSDIVSGDDLENLYQSFPNLAGDRDIGVSDFEGQCQDWRGDKGWWQRFGRR